MQQWMRGEVDVSRAPADIPQLHRFMGAHYTKVVMDSGCMSMEMKGRNNIHPLEPSTGSILSGAGRTLQC